MTSSHQVGQENTRNETNTSQTGVTRETSTSQTGVTREALVTSRKEVKPLVTSCRRVWRQKMLLARHMPIASRCHFFLFRSEAYHEELNVHEELFFFTLTVDEDEFAEINREMRRREDVELRYVRFDLNGTRTLSVKWLMIPFFALRKQAPQSVWSKKKRLMCKKKSKDKKSSKIQPAPVLVRMFWGRFRTRSDSIGHARGHFLPNLTRSGVRVRRLGLVWTSGPTRSDRDQHQTRSRTRHRNLTRLVSHALLTSQLAHSWSLVSVLVLDSILKSWYFKLLLKPMGFYRGMHIYMGRNRVSVPMGLQTDGLANGILQ